MLQIRLKYISYTLGGLLRSIILWVACCTQLYFEWPVALNYTPHRCSSIYIINICRPEMWRFYVTQNFLMTFYQFVFLRNSGFFKKFRPNYTPLSVNVTKKPLSHMPEKEMYQNWPYAFTLLTECISNSFAQMTSPSSGSCAAKTKCIRSH
jgi:hypothetical protein